MRFAKQRPGLSVFDSRKPLLLGLILILTAALLAGCGKSGDSSDQTADTSGDQGPTGTAPPDELVLFAPSLSTTTYLVDASNQPVQRWRSEYVAGQSAFLLDDGSILRAGSINDVAPDNRFVAGYRDGHNEIFQVGGIIERISKDSKVEWSFEYYGDDYAPHHVVTVMPNGNLLMPVWRYISRDDAIALGRDPKHVSKGGLWMDSLVEFRPTEDGAEVVWEWNAGDHLVQDFDESKADFGEPVENPGRIDINWGRGFNVPEDFMHINSAFYLEEYDQVVFTSYHYSELWVIDHSTTTEEAAGSTGGQYGRGGELLYRWGNPGVYGHDDTDQFLLSAVHDPKWVAKTRHFIMYDNNVADPGRNLDGGNSRVVEIAPPIRPDGRYEIEGGVYGPSQPVSAADLGVAASAVGTAQRLANGDTLSCDCIAGETIWLDPDGNVLSTAPIWENTTKDEVNTQVFRLVTYSKSDPGVLALGLGGG